MNSSNIEKSTIKRTIIYIMVFLAVFQGPMPVLFAAIDDVPGMIQNADVAHGVADGSVTGNTLTITTGGPKTIVNYDMFNINSGWTVNFQQPNANAATLNRVVAANPSQIAGTLQSNGKVFLINPAGVMFGSGAVVNVTQLVASALDMSNSDFLSDKLYFTGSPTDSVANAGTINAELVSLIGKEVINTGQINCPNGYVILAAGDTVYLKPETSVILVEVGTITPGSQGIVMNNTGGNLNAVGLDGTVILAAAGDALAVAVSNTGGINAGKTQIQAAQTEISDCIIDVADVKIAGDASIENASVTGNVSADKLTLEGTVNASGSADQIFEAPQDWLTANIVNKTHTGNLTLKGSDGVDLNGNIAVHDGDLILSNDTTVAANTTLKASDNITIETGATLSGDTALTLEATGGAISGGTIGVSGSDLTLIQSADIDLSTMELLNQADTELSLYSSGGSIIADSGANAADRWSSIIARSGNGNVTLEGSSGTRGINIAPNGDLLGEATLFASGNIAVADSQGITISTDATASGIAFSNQVMANSTGAQSFNAGTGTLAAVGITKAAGQLTLNGDTDINVEGDISAVGLTFNDAVTASGNGSQTLEAGTGTLTVQSINKAAGQLSLGGDMDINVEGDISAVGLTFNDAVTASGAGAQTFDAGTGVLSAKGITKSADHLTLSGEADINLEGDVSAIGLVFSDAVTASSAGFQAFDAGAGTLTAKGISKASGQLSLGGDTDINVEGNIDAVGLTFNDAVTASGTAAQAFDAGTGVLSTKGITKSADQLTLSGDADINLEGDVSAVGLLFSDAVTASGAGLQAFDAGAGTLTAKSISKASGPLTLGGDTDINLEGDVSAVGLTFSDAATASGAGLQTFDAGTGTLAAKGINKAAGPLTLGGDLGINLESDISAVGLTFNDAVTATGNVVQTFDAMTGTLRALNTIEKLSNPSGLILKGGSGIQLDNNVTVNHSLTLLSDNSSITGSGIITVNGSELTINQYDSIVLSSMIFSNQENTELSLYSTNGSVTANMGANAADQWSSIIARADNGNVTLEGSDGIRGINIASNGNSLGQNVLSASGNIAVADSQGITISTDATASGIAFNNQVTANGAGTQSFNAGTGTLATKGITKSAGQLTLDGDTDINVEGDISAVGLTFNDAVTASGAGAQTFEAGTGTLEAKDINKAAGQLILGGDTDINVEGNVSAIGLTFNDAVTASGVGVQTFEAGTGTLAAKGINKAAGQLTLGGDTDINVEGNVSAVGLTFDDAVTASGTGVQTFEAGTGTLAAKDINKAVGQLTLGGDADINVEGNVSAVGLTFNDAVTASGAGTQTFEAGTDTLAAKDINKAAGQLNLGGDTDINVEGNVSAVGLTFNDAVTASGVGVQTFEAGTDTLAAKDINKAAGQLTLGGDTDINVEGNVSSVGLTFNDAVTASGAGVQTFDAGTGTLAAKDINKAAGQLTLGGDTDINVEGNVSAVGLTFNDTVTASGAGTQTFEAGTGALTAKSINKTVGQLNLGGDTGINVEGNVSAVGLIFSNATIASGAGTQTFEAGTGTLTAKSITKTAGQLNLGGDTGINVEGNVSAVGLTFNDAVTASGAGPQAFDAQTGILTAKWITKDADTLTLSGDGGIQSAAGNIEITATKDIQVNDSVTAAGGGVKIVSEEGSIYTDDGSGTLNVAITGSSSDTGGIGVDLPGGFEKAAIVIISKTQDLNLGSGAVLTANGSYDPAPDDRSSISFFDEGPQGLDQKAGVACDVAIYLASYFFDTTTFPKTQTGGSLTIDSAGISCSSLNATVVLDAMDTVGKTGKFGDTLEGYFKTHGQDFRIETVSRSSDSKQEAMFFNRLPYLSMDALPWGPSAGDFVYRGMNNDTNPDAQVLAAVLGYVNAPVVPPALRPLEFKAETKAVDIEEVKRWARVNLDPLLSGQNDQQVYVSATDIVPLKTLIDLYEHYQIMVKYKAPSKALEGVLPDNVTDTEAAITTNWLAEQVAPIPSETDRKLTAAWVNSIAASYVTFITSTEFKATDDLVKYYLAMNLKPLLDDPGKEFPKTAFAVDQLIGGFSAGSVGQVGMN